MVTMPTDEELTRASEILARVAESNTEAGAMLRVARRFAEAVAAQGAPARRWLSRPDAPGWWWVHHPNWTAPDLVFVVDPATWFGGSRLALSPLGERPPACPRVKCSE